MKHKKITYDQVGDNYSTKDPIKKLAQSAAGQTGKNLRTHGFEEVTDSRGESAYVWKQGDVHMASVIEGLGTKNLVADSHAADTPHRTFYDVIGHDTVATIINDLTTVGATPLVVHAYWAVEDNIWLQNQERMQDLIAGWKHACDLSGASWGGGETPTMKGVMKEGTCELGGSAVGIISNDSHLLLDTKLQEHDRIILLKSNGVNANGLSLARAIAEKLPDGYATTLPDGISYGDSLLTKTNIYAPLLSALQRAEIHTHYISNITGHGLRKIMRAKGDFTYTIEHLFQPHTVFTFMQQEAGLSDEEAYATWNMGQDYALFLPEEDVKKTLDIITTHGFEGIDAGYIKKGERKVSLLPKHIVYTEESLDLR
ncbi:MAG: hypothetical protein RLZZ455_804 [Candidatus Parcubacteria bacterium]|jgi:phosphoribosylformylglycinamidine cyclo-ligase